LDDAGKPVAGVPISAMNVMPEVPPSALRGLTVLAAKRKERRKAAEAEIADEAQHHQEDMEAVTSQEETVSLEAQVEEFLFSLGATEGESIADSRMRKAKLARLQQELSVSGAISKEELNALEAEIGRLEEDSLVLRNLTSMGARQQLRPARVLGALIRVMNLYKEEQR
jgi:hypothetical protein